VSRVDFYVLSQEGGDARLRVACRLAEKAVEQGSRVYIQADSLAAAQRLDDLLWMFNDRSFLPHEITQGNEASHARVMILLGESTAPPGHRQLLINLTNAVPVELDGYERIAEIVDIDPDSKRLSRERYKAYRDRGCELESHNL
jgi:DNA polymerase-3 subunit chi